MPGDDAVTMRHSQPTSPPHRKPRFWDNLVALRPGFSGTQTAGWTPGPAARTGCGFQLLADQRVEVAEGVALAADVYLPAGTGRHPAVLCFGAYTKELQPSGAPVGHNEVGSPPVFTGRGYAHVVVERRGMGQSGGETASFFNETEVDDHEKLIAWVAAQPWCDGRVVLFGTSYYGCLQPMVAARRPPALQAFFCNEICTDYYRQVVCFGGTPNVYFLSTWIGANFTARMQRLRIAPVVRALLSQVLNSGLKRWWWPAVRKRMPAIVHGFMHATPVEEVRRMWLNWVVDAKSRATCEFPQGPYAVLNRIDVPFVTVQNRGYFNLHQFGSYELFQKAGTAADRKWLIVGEAEYRLPVYCWQLEALAFFDHILHAAPNGYASQPAVRYWVDGARRYAGAAAFPPAHAQAQRLYLDSCGEDKQRHALTVLVPAESSNSWVGVPPGAPLPGGLEAIANQELVYELVIHEATELVGRVTANLCFSCNEIDSYVLARLSRVDVAGQDELLSLGAIAPARRRVDGTRGSDLEIAIDTDTPEPLVPGQAVLLRFSLTPAPVRLERGERLRLTIASRTDRVLSDVSRDHAHFPLHVPPYYARNRLHHGPQTYLELMRMPNP